MDNSGQNTQKNRLYPHLWLAGRGREGLIEENRKHMKSFDVYYVENSGHFVMQEKPKEFNAMLRTILQQLEGEK